MLISDMLQPGDVILSKNAGIATFLIRWWTKSPYTHVDVYVGDLYGVSLAVGAGPVFGGVFSKVRAVLVDNITSYEVFRTKLNEEQRTKISRFLISRIGGAYSYKMFFLYGYRSLMGKLGIYKNDPFPEEWVCSELAAYAFDSVGITVGESPVNTVPADFVRCGKFVRVIERIK